MKTIIISWWLAFAVLLLTMQNVQASCWNLMDAECLAPLILGDDYSKDKNSPKYIKEWSPVQGMVTTIGYSFFFEFKFDDEAIRIIRSNPLLSFEAEVVIEGSDRHKIEVTSFGAGANLHSANIGLDTEAFDSSSKRTIGLHFLDPQNLEAGVDYKFIIQTNKELANLDISIRPQTQILLDVSSYASLMNVFGIESWSNQIWDFYDQVGQYNYFSLETDGFVKFDPYENGRDRRSVIWNDHESSFVVSNDNSSGNGTSNNPQIFTIDNHTHVIANDYRCSKETDGPILCWEAGGNTNCWNAWNWYQFNGEVSQVADHHNDSGWVTNLSRDFTCNQVYNSGTNTSTGGDLGGTSYGTGNGTGNGYHNDSGDPWSGYVHHVGLQYLKIGKKSSGHWKGSKVWALSQIPTKRDFRVKLKRKGGKWTNVCAEIWFSHNKYFTDDDLYLGKECKKLSKKKYRKKKKKSVYVKNVSIPKMEAGKNYYFFTRVTYDGGVNVSDDSDEYVKVEIADISSKFKVDEVFGETPFTVNFTNKSKAVFGYITSYHWSFGDGTTSNEENPIHTYTQAGAFTVQLTTTANWGEQKTSSVTVVANNPVPDPPVDTDGDGITDDNEPGDTDNDGLANWEESFLFDADNDGVNDQLDAENFNPANDSDNDGFTNEEEKIVGTNPLNNDSFPDTVEEDNSNLQDSCQETAETATNGGWGWNPVTEQGCLVNYYRDSGSDESDSEDYCHETDQTATNGGWGWNPVTEQGCLVVTDDNTNNEDNCEPTADTDTNGGWGWNSVTEQGCLVSGSFDETEDDTTINPDDSENYCHETDQTATNGGWGWNPVTQEGCLVNP